jgi:Xaa-Pro aminopeptidase
MLQSFDDHENPAATSGRLASLRAELVRQGLDGLIVPRQDEFQGEYVAAYAERLRWLTGFAGSWGLAIILADRAAIFVDGRYTLQVREEVDSALFTPRHLIDEPPPDWVEKNLREGQILGYDPWLLTPDHVSGFKAACGKAGATLKAVEHNPVDIVWTDRPARPRGPIDVQPTRFAGRTPAEKLAEVAAALTELRADAVLLTLPDSIAWVFNIRGRDVAYTPTVLTQAIVYREGMADLFADRARFSGGSIDHLARIAAIRDPAELDAALSALGARKATVLVDPSSVPERLRALLQAHGATIMTGRDPCMLPKARKNRVEQEGARTAHRRDGAAMVRFLHWLEISVRKTKLDEIAVAEKLAQFREETGALEDLAFTTVAGAGPNAASPHYRVTRRSSRRLGRNGLLLIDSGGQYRDGTTDITRTVILGKPTNEMKNRFTTVLKGMIGISTVRFPKGTCGSQIDILARTALWQMGLDYDHGTGHGVGSYLSVHEGPARINKTDRTALEPGMILSNEPGYYKPGRYGIRIENLLLVHEPRPVPGGERPMMGFETLTLCPIDRRLIEAKLLAAGELAWLNAYHARVAKELGPLLGQRELKWLRKACAPVRKRGFGAPRR